MPTTLLRNVNTEWYTAGLEDYTGLDLQGSKREYLLSVSTL